MRIAVWHNLPSGGGKRALHLQVAGLVARGHDVEAWCPASANQTYLPLSELVEEHVLPLDLEPVAQLRDLARSGRRSAFAHNLAALDAHQRAVAAEIGTRFDVLLAGTCQVTAVPSVGRHASVPSVLYLQEPSRVLYEAFFRRDNEKVEPPQFPWTGSRAVVRAARALGGFAQRNAPAYRILVNSRYSRESVLRAYGLDSEVCYLGIDTDVFRPSNRGPRDYVVGVGAFVAEKNIDFVLETLARLAPSPPPLLWIGNHRYSDAYVEDLCQLAGSLGVAFEPRSLVSDEELIQSIAGARLMAYAPRLEPFGLAPLEASACGVPVVGVAEAGIRETVVTGRNGLLAEASVDDFASAIAQLWSDADAALELGRRGRAWTEEFWTVDAAAARLESALRRAVAGPGSAQVDR